MTRWLASLLAPLGILAGLVVVWLALLQLIDVPRYVIPGPVEVVRAIVSDPGSYASATGQTLADAGAGFIAGMVMGFTLAVVIAEVRLARAFALPWVLLLRSVPIVAIAPLLTLVYGFGFVTVVIIAAIVAFFPTFVLTSAGLRDTPPGSAAVFYTLGATRLDELIKLRLPSSVIHMLGATKIAAAGAVLGAMVGEWTTSNRGLGYMIVVATGNFETDRVWAAGAVATAIAVGAFVIADRLALYAAEKMT